MRRVLLAFLVVGAMAIPPLAQADDPDPPTFRGVAVDPGPYHAGDLVNFTIDWEDASGLASVWGGAEGPGGLNSFWVSCADPQGDRVAHVACTLQLNAKTPGGAYHIRSVGAMDVVGHYAEAVVHAPFTVDSPFTDMQGPDLLAVHQNVTSFNLASNLTSWNQVIEDAFSLETRDDSNVTYANLHFRGPNGNQGMHGQCDRWVGRRATCSLYADAQLPAGDYRMDQLQVNDEIGYISVYLDQGGWDSRFRDLGAVVPEPLIVHLASARTDAEPPMLTDLTFPGQLHRGQPFELRLNATDASVIESAQVFFATTRGNAGYSVWHATDCTGEPAPERHLVCTGRFPDNFPLGLALVNWLMIEDEGRNMAWLRPSELGCCNQAPFEDGDRFDVGTVLVPRPIEGVLEAVDAVVNEVLPGEAATLVYRTEDAVDDVRLVLADAADGSIVEVGCAEAVTTRLGEECTFQVPADESGVLSLVQATTVVGEVAQTSTYGAGEVPLLAVHGTIPRSASLPIARGGGPLNQVGHDWAEAFLAAKQAMDEPASGNDVERPMITAEPPAPGPAAPPPPPVPVAGNETAPAAPRRASMDGPSRQALPDAQGSSSQPHQVPGPNATFRAKDDVAVQLEDDGDVGAVDIPLPAAPAMLALALAALGHAALGRRR